MGSKPSKKKKAEKQAQQPIKKQKKKKTIEGIRGIVRIAEKDVDGHKKVRHALLQINGISHALANAIPSIAKIDPNVMIGSLSEEDVAKLEKAIKELSRHVPGFMLNRRKDMLTGEDKHVVSSELLLTKKNDIDLMRKIQCYKGVRHQLGLPVRGQRTRSSFRKGIGVGVIRKKKGK